MKRWLWKVAVPQAWQDYFLEDLLIVQVSQHASVQHDYFFPLSDILLRPSTDLKDINIVVPLCGGNIDTTVLGRVLERGLAADDRLKNFTATVSDRRKSSQLTPKCCYSN